ncbi:MAG: hypothetical protein AB7S65_02690 [Sulfuricurvum sp.]
MKFLLSLILTVLFALGDEPEEHPKLPLQQSLPYLRSIEHNAIIMGEGAIKVYVFIDPNCPNSRNFISLIDENGKMRSKYTYCFFLYELKRFHSSELIAKIYSSSHPLETLKRVMIHDEIPSNESNPAVLDKISQIAKVAEKLDVYKRPYIIMVKRES